MTHKSESGNRVPQSIRPYFTISASRSCNIIDLNKWTHATAPTRLLLHNLIAIAAAKPPFNRSPSKVVQLGKNLQQWSCTAVVAQLKPGAGRQIATLRNTGGCVRSFVSPSGDQTGESNVTICIDLRPQEGCHVLTDGHSVPRRAKACSLTCYVNPIESARP